MMGRLTFEDFKKMEAVAANMVDTLGLVVMQMTMCTCIAHERLKEMEAAKTHIQNQFPSFLFDHDSEVFNAMTTDPNIDQTPVAGLCKTSLLWARDETERFLGVKK